jgi:hypothetical protein
MPILTRSGRIVIAESIAARPIHLAWGTGDGSWVGPPAESNLATALLNEIGRRTATEVAFAIEDVAGDIVLPTGRFSRSVNPTNFLYINTVYDFADAFSSVIREVGVFVGGTMNPGLPVGQKYFVPADYVLPGRMLHVENMAPIYRSPAIRPSFEIVVAF